MKLDRVIKILLIPLAGFAIFSLYIAFFRPPDIYWTRHSPWEPGPLSLENSLQEAGRNGLPACFRLDLEREPAEAEVGDCLLLVPSERSLNTVEVNLQSGQLMLIHTDFTLSDSPAISFTRVIPAWSLQANSRWFPGGHLYDIFPTGSRWPYTYININLPDGQSLYYWRISPGERYDDAVYEHTATRGPFYGSRFKWNGNGWALKRRDGTVYVFPESYSVRYRAQAALVGLRDPSGRVIDLERDPSGNLAKVTSPDGQQLRLAYAGTAITRIKSSEGPALNYLYDAHGRLSTVTSDDGDQTRYTYDDSGRLLSIKSPSPPRGALDNAYDSNGRAVRLVLASGTVYRLAYKTDLHGNIIQAGVSKANRTIATVTFHGSRYELTVP